MRSTRFGEDWLGQGALCAVGHCAGAPAFPAGSGQLGAEGRASCCGVVWGFCIVVGFYRSRCPGTIRQVLTHLLFPRGKMDKSHTSGSRWSYSRTRTAA